MTNLVIMKDQQAVTTSLNLAESFEKEHKNVIQAIESKIQSAENSAHYEKCLPWGLIEILEEENRRCIT